MSQFGFDLQQLQAAQALQQLQAAQAAQQYLYRQQQGMQSPQMHNPLQQMQRQMGLPHPGAQLPHTQMNAVQQFQQQYQQQQYQHAHQHQPHQLHHQQQQQQQRLPAPVPHELQKKLADTQYALAQEEEHERSNIQYAQKAQQQEQSQENYKKVLEEKEAGLDRQIQDLKKREEDLVTYEAGLGPERAKVGIAKEKVALINEGNEWLRNKNQKLSKRHQYYNPFLSMTGKFQPRISSTTFHAEYNPTRHTKRTGNNAPESGTFKQYNRLWLNGNLGDFKVKPNLRETPYITLSEEVFVGVVPDENEERSSTVVKVVLLEHEVGDPQRHPTMAMAVWGKNHKGVFDLYTAYHNAARDGPADAESTHYAMARRALMEQANVTLPDDTRFAHLCSYVDDDGVTTYFVMPEIDCRKIVVHNMKVEVTTTKTIKVLKTPTKPVETAEDTKMEAEEEKPAEAKKEEETEKKEEEKDEEEKKPEEGEEGKTDEEKEKEKEKEAEEAKKDVVVAETKPAEPEIVEEEVTETKQHTHYSASKQALARLLSWYPANTWAANVLGATLEDMLRYKYGNILLETLREMPHKPKTAKPDDKDKKQDEPTTGKRKREEEEEPAAEGDEADKEEAVKEDVAKKQKKEVERFERVEKTQFVEESVKCVGVKPFLFLDKPHKNADGHWHRTGIVGLDDMIELMLPVAKDATLGDLIELAGRTGVDHNNPFVVYRQLFVKKDTKVEKQKSGPRPQYLRL